MDQLSLLHHEMKAVNIWLIVKPLMALKKLFGPMQSVIHLHHEMKAVNIWLIVIRLIALKKINFLLTG